MDKQKVNELAKTIDLKSNSDREFFLIHGYTGSPRDFNDLPELLHKKFNANVKIIRLIGHGTNIDDLDKLEHKHFLKQIESELKKDLHKGRKIVLGGLCFGGQVALYLASKYPVSGVFNVSTPYCLKFPLNLPGIGIVGMFKKKLKKFVRPAERRMRENTFHYRYMHRNGLKITKECNRLLDRHFSYITCPCLTIHARKDSISRYIGAEHIHKKIGSVRKRKAILKGENHNLFFSKYKNDALEEIVNFFKKERVFDKKLNVDKPKVAAIVCAYNEGERIGEVLKSLTRANCLSEVIVVNDGSKDNTEEVVKKFNVKYLKNEVNRGKGYSMERGVNSTNADIIFFCDADLQDFKPGHVEEIIKPVIEKECDMFIGVRNDIMQKSFTPYAINSGERALRREIWENLPRYFKHRYRIEMGLNHFVKNNGRGFRYKVLSYFQTLKEKKHGFVKGTLLRWWMNFDVASAYMKAKVFDRLGF